MPSTARMLLTATLLPLALLPSALASALPFALASSADAQVAQVAPVGQTLDVARAAVVATRTDARGDVTFTAHRDGLTRAAARPIDLDSFTASYAIGSGSDVLVFALTTAAPARTGSDERVTLHVTTTGIRPTPASRVDVVFAPAAGPDPLTVRRGAHRAPCPGTQWRIQAAQIVLVVPRSCLGASQARFRFGASSALLGPRGPRAVDSIRATSPVRLDRAGLGSWSFTESAGDVTYAVDPATNGYAADSVDLAASAAATAGHDGLRLHLAVADPAYYPWDVKQRYTVTVTDAAGRSGSLVVDPNRAEDGATSLTGTGTLTGCSTATFTVTPDVGLDGTIPAACLATTTATVEASATALTEDDTATGSDTTGPSDLILLG